APSLIHLEILNVAGRRWGWGADALGELAEGLDDLSFDLVEPELLAVARWVAVGLAAHDAAYVAVAEAAAIPLLTTDSTILVLARDLAQALLYASRVCCCASSDVCCIVGEADAP